MMSVNHLIIAVIHVILINEVIEKIYGNTPSRFISRSVRNKLIVNIMKMKFSFLEKFEYSLKILEKKKDINIEKFVFNGVRFVLKNFLISIRNNASEKIVWINLCDKKSNLMKIDIIILCFLWLLVFL